MVKEPQEKPAMTVKEMAAMGGRSRAKGLSKQRRKEIAKKAAAARWAKKDKKT